MNVYMSERTSERMSIAACMCVYMRGGKRGEKNACVHVTVHTLIDNFTGITTFANGETRKSRTSFFLFRLRARRSSLATISRRSCERAKARTYRRIERSVSSIGNRFYDLSSRFTSRLEYLRRCLRRTEMIPFSIPCSNRTHTHIHRHTYIHTLQTFLINTVQ